MKKMIRIFIIIVIVISAVLAFNKETSKKDTMDTITLFAAKSLGPVLDELLENYQKEHSDVVVVRNYDSSGTLMTQIKEGASCDIFFSAATKQMDDLEDKVMAGTRHDILNNQVCVVTYQGSHTKVTGLKDMDAASSLAIADGSVPVGRYTRQALVNAGIVQDVEDVSKITTETIGNALGNVEINECSNVGAVKAAVAEGANEVGTVYLSDTYGFGDKLQILEKVPYELTGDVIYPVAQIENREASEKQKRKAAKLMDFLTSDYAKTVYEKYLFDVVADS